MSWLACSSCFLGDEERTAYLVSTALLLLVPAGLLLAFGLWLRAATAREPGP